MVAVVVLIVSVIGYVIGVKNDEVALRVLAEAKQTDNTSEFDNMWKKISQVAQVTDEQKNALKEIFVEHAQARTTEGGGSLMKWVQESVPNVDLSVYKNLQNMIMASRDAWTMRQKELIDIKREHDKLLRTIPSCWVLGGVKPLEIVVITSTKTTAVFKTGKDDDVNLFQKKETAVEK